MAASPTYTYGMGWLQPVYHDRTSRMISVQLAAGTYVAGTILGQLTSTGVSDVQTITSTGTGGTFTLSVPASPYAPPPFSWSASPVTITAPIAWNATAAAVQAALDAVYGPGNTRVTGGPLGAAVVVTFAGALAATPMGLMTANNANLTGGAATVAHTTTGVANSGVFTTYNSGASDGSQIAKGLLKYPCTVDASGNITISGNVPGLSDLGAPMYYAGTFRCESIPGLTTAVVTALSGNVIIGSVTSGVVHFG